MTKQLSPVLMRDMTPKSKRSIEKLGPSKIFPPR